jgi:hypothetical protein
MARITAGSNPEWPRKLFGLRGFGRCDVRYDAKRDKVYVIVGRHSDGQPTEIDLPEGYLDMTIFDLRNWVDTEVEKISGPSDFPTISLKPQAASIDG